MSNVSLVGARATASRRCVRRSVPRTAAARARRRRRCARIERFNERESAALAKSGGEKEKRGLDRLVHFVCGHRFVWMSLEVVLVYLSFMIAFYITFFGREMYNFLLRLDGGRVTMQTKCSACRGKEGEEGIPLGGP